jgi:CubicO group peptidase (beta-lactamase class C family)
MRLPVLVLLLLVGLPLVRPAAAPPPNFAAVDAAVLAGIRKRVYPGAVVVIGRRDKILYSKGYGRFTWSSRSPRPRPDSTLWDLASLTKVVGTTSAVMRLVDAGALELDAPVSRYFPRFSGGAKDQVTVRMLLDHTSGLRPYLPFFRKVAGRDEAVTLLVSDTLVRAPGASPVYSDLNAILLGLVVEAVTDTSLDAVVRREVFTPLGMRQTMFHPGPTLIRRTAPSGAFRGQPIAGVVNDQNAQVFGGVAGHAGIFGTGRDLARFAQAWLRLGNTPSGPWVGTTTMRQFLSGTPASGTRLLGWDTRDEEAEESSFGSLLSPAAYGHTGWTGTAIWIDPARDLFVVFLTNRSFDPKARNSLGAIRTIRSNVTDAAARLAPVQCVVAQAAAQC